MMRWIMTWCLKFRLVVFCVAAALMIFGTVQLRSAPVDALPEFAPPYVEVQTEALGLSASEVEELVTLNLEELLSGTPFLQSIHSTSVPGLSSIVLVFEPGTDVIRARQLVAERLSLAVTIPNVALPPTIIQPVSATNRVMMVGLSSSHVSAIQMSVIARWTIRPALLSVPGVSNVAIWGMRDRQLQVQVDPQRLAAEHVTIDQIVSTTGNALWVSPLSFLNASAPGTGGYIDTPQQRLGVQNVLPISSADDLAKVSLDGTNRRLGDVATVVEDHQPLIGDDVLKQDPGLLVVIEKFPGANTLDVTRGVEAKLKELQPGLTGIQIDTNDFRPANFIEMAMSNLTRSLLIAGLLVLLAFLFFQWRLALISLVTIPLSLVAAGLVLYWRGATINTMILAGLVLALGILIDDVVSDVENIVRRLRQHRQVLAAGESDDRSTARVIIDASLEVRGPMIYATLIILLTLLPVVFLTGVTGAFFQPLAIAYALALLASMLVALTVTPALSLLLLSRAPLERRESPLIVRLQRRYSAVLQRVIRVPYPALATVCLIMLLGVSLVPLLSGALFPTFKEPDITVQLQAVPGTSYPEMTRITTLMSRQLRSVSGVQNVVATVGRAVLGDQAVDVNSAQLVVSVDPNANYDKTVAAIEKTAKGYPGIDHDVQTYLNSKINEVLVGSSDDLVVRIFGPNLDTLRSKADEVRRSLSQIPGTTDVHTEVQVDQPQIQVTVDLAKAQQYGLKPGDVRRLASTLVEGITAGSLYDQQKVFDVVVVGTPQTRHSLDSVRNLLLDTPNGQRVRLGDVAAVSIQSAPSMVPHDTISRRIDVGMHIRGRDPAAVAHEVQQRLAAISFPLEYRAEVLGEYLERQAAQRQLLTFGLAAALAVFLLLQAAFGSWRLAMLAFFTLPSALVGGVLAVWASGGVISLGSLVGFFTVFGIAARNGIMLISHCQHLEREEGETFGPDLVLRGARERLAPILMTALAAGLALLPLVVTGDIPGQEIEHPMAIVILGGLVTSTLLNLFILPTLYLRFGSKVAHVEFETVRRQPDAVPGAAQ